LLFRIRLLVAFLYTWIAVSAFSEEKIITGNFDLNSLSDYLPSATGPQLKVRIDNYAHPGRLKIDQAYPNVSTLTLQRFSQDSDAVIPVDTVFIDAKGFAGTLELRGLAFKLKPKALLISGYDLAKANHHLILDSCFLYADSLDGSFLLWQGDPESNIEIRNSWFVVKSSATNLANLQVAGGKVTLTNCLFNFPGLITGSPISQSFTARYNTLNRVQVNLVGTNYNNADPTYSFTQNLIAYHGPANGLGGDPYYFLKASAFNDPSSVIQSNRIYLNEWKGFDAPAGLKGSGTRKTDPSFDGKSVSELWNWYTDSTDPGTGMLSGIALARHYNVFPGATYADTIFGGEKFHISFRSADYPRLFRVTLGALPALADSAFRLRASVPGSVYFGPFQVDNIVDSTVAKYGKPVLLAQSTDSSFKSQAGGSRVRESPSVFQNRSPLARVFVLVDSGNTPRGPSVEPTVPSAEKFEHLRFAKVLSAGYTSYHTPNTQTPVKMPNSLRYLQQTFGFQTTANVQGSALFASKYGTKPWAAPEDNALFWYWKAKDSLLPATQGTAWGDSSLLYGSIENANADTAFIFYLVEKLSVYADSNFRRTILPGADFLSNSAAGYQLHVDTTGADADRYGWATKGFKFTWTGRGQNDSLFLILKSPVPEAKPFVQVPGKPDADSLPYTADTEGYFKIPIDAADAGKTFFAGVKYNVLAGTYFSGVVNGVKVDSLYSIAPGVAAYKDLSEFDARSLGSDSLNVFRNARLLAGKQDIGKNLNVKRDFSLSFPIAKPLGSDTAEAWAFAGGRWVKIRVARLSAGGDSIRVSISLADMPVPTAIVVLERFLDPETYVTPNISSSKKKDSLFVNLIQKDSTKEIPLAGFCVVLRTIDTAGTLKESGCQTLSTKATFGQALDPGLGYAYSVNYVVGSGSDTARLMRDFQYPDSLGWNLKSAFDHSNAKLKQPVQSHWRLVALPLDGPLGPYLKDSTRTDTAKIKKDTTLLLDLKSKGDSTWYDTVPKAPRATHQYTLTRGRSVLMASSHQISVRLDSASARLVVTAKPDSVDVDSGWNLIANPYPITFRRECITSSPSSALQNPAIRLWNLAYNDSNKYSWPEWNGALPPFTGYAYFSRTKAKLVFDPACPAASPKTAVRPSTRVQVGIQTTFGASAMSLMRGEGEYPIGFLPAPAAGLELRVGGGGGYLMKPIADPSRIDEPVEIRSAHAGPADFRVEGGPSTPAFALIDLATGRAYDAASARSLPLREGAQAYRLVAGDPAFVAERAGTFQASAPAALALSQNFPNPARGLTRIAVDWPATSAQDRRAYLEVIDLRGRRIALKRLDDIRIGRQLIELDAGNWKPGLYVYRLVVTAGGRVERLQKRMLVSP
jgi:hypothetical protein